MPDEREEELAGHRTEHGASEIVPVAADLRVGTQVAGYRIDRVVGRGGMGVVYRATHLHLDRTVAIKVLIPELVRNPDFRDRFLRESRTAASINHPNIVTIYDAAEADGLLYIAMQYVEGADLGELLEREGALEPERAVAILAQVGAALDVAHAHGIVHRDVKPANVLIDAERCYLTDFGLAKSVSSKTALTAKGQFVGTVHYMAPEQIKGTAVDAQSDVYALGCVSYHALTGKIPFERDSEISEVYAHLEDPPPALLAERPELPTGLGTVLSSALAKRREDRPQTAGAFVAALKEALGGDPAGRDLREAGAPPAAVLVIARQPTTRALVQGSLKGHVRVLEAMDVESATRVLGSEEPELALIDWEEAGAAAPELCRVLRDRPQTSPIKVLALVGRAPDAGPDSVQAGADDYIVKPFSPLQVLYKVRDVVGAGRLKS